MKELNATPEVQVLESSPSESMAVDFRVKSSESMAVDFRVKSSESMAVDFSVKGAERFRVLVAALRTLGFSAAQAKRRLERVGESFGAGVSEASDEDIVKKALRFSAA